MTRGRWIAWAAFAAGALVALAVIAAGRTTPGEPLRAGAVVAASATGGIAISPEGPLLDARGLAPGEASAQGRLTVLNQTSETASVIARVTGDPNGLDGSLRFRLRAGDAPAVEASLGDLRAWRRLWPLGSQRAQDVYVQVLIPPSVEGGYEARRATVTLELAREGVTL